MTTATVPRVAIWRFAMGYMWRETVAMDGIVVRVPGGVHSVHKWRKHGRYAHVPDPLAFCHERGRKIPAEDLGSI